MIMATESGNHKAVNIVPGKPKGWSMGFFLQPLSL
jgi:hypothetical protein